MRKLLVKHKVAPLFRGVYEYGALSEVCKVVMLFQQHYHLQGRFSDPNMPNMSTEPAVLVIDKFCYVV